MFDTMRRLHLRGPASRGIAVDAEGAMLGPDCILVCRESLGYRGVDRRNAGALQEFLLGNYDDPDWLFRQCRRIADALDRGEIALAQLYGLRIPINELDETRLKQLAAAAPFIRTGFDPAEPRVPKGDPRGGQWTGDGGGGTGNQVAAGHDCAQIIAQCKGECIAVYAGEGPGTLPGVGPDMFGRTSKMHTRMRRAPQLLRLLR